MKRMTLLLLILTLVLTLSACGRHREPYTIEIIIPPGSTDDYVYADAEISPLKNKLKISAGAGISSAEILLKPITGLEETSYEPVILRQGDPVKLNVENGVWFQIGVGIQNPSDRAITVSIQVEDAEIRIS